MHAGEVQAYKVHVYEVHTLEMHACEVHSCEVYAREMHVHDMIYDHMVHAHHMHDRKGHAHETPAHHYFGGSLAQTVVDLSRSEFQNTSCEVVPIALRNQITRVKLSSHISMWPNGVHVTGSTLSGSLPTARRMACMDPPKRVSGVLDIAQMDLHEALEGHRGLAGKTPRLLCTSEGSGGLRSFVVV